MKQISKKIISWFLSVCTVLTAQGMSIVATEIRAFAEGHTYTKCTSGFEYELDGDYAIISGYNGSATDVVVEYGGSIDGHIITGVADNAFYDNDNITSVDINIWNTDSSGVFIGDYAFYGCDNLISAKIKLTGSKKTVGRYAFSNCKLLSSINYEGTTIGDYAFEGCNELREAYLYMHMGTVGTHAFFNCQNLSDLYLNSYKGTIRNSAFANCVSLESAYFPSYYMNFDEMSFANCTSLEYLMINSTSISANAFYNCSSLREAYIVNDSTDQKDKITAIGDSAFEKCPLVYVSLPKAITNIGNNCFDFSTTTFIIDKNSATDRLLSSFNAKSTTVENLKKYTQGDGTENNPFIIANYYQFQNIASNLHANYRLANDIRVPTFAWNTIGTSTNPFSGSLNGDGHKIYNLGDCANASTASGGGIFAYTDNAVIIDLVVESASHHSNMFPVINIKPSSDVPVGTLVGSGSGKIINCGVLGDLNIRGGYSAYTNKDARIGCLTGHFDGIIENCFFIGSLASSPASNDRSGAFAYDGNYTIKNCFADYTHTTNVGYVAYSNTNLFTGLSSGTLENCYVKYLDTKEVWSNYVGEGGHKKAPELNTSLLTNCYYTCSSEYYLNKEKNPSLARTLSEMSDVSTYNNWDFENVWVMDQDTGLPTLKWFREFNENHNIKVSYNAAITLGESHVAIIDYYQNEKKQKDFSFDIEILDPSIIDITPVKGSDFEKYLSPACKITGFNIDHCFMIKGESEGTATFKVKVNGEEVSKSIVVSEPNYNFDFPVFIPLMTKSKHVSIPYFDYSSLDATTKRKALSDAKYYLIQNEGLVEPSDEEAISWINNDIDEAYAKEFIRWLNEYGLAEAYLEYSLEDDEDCIQAVKNKVLNSPMSMPLFDETSNTYILKNDNVTVKELMAYIIFASESHKFIVEMEAAIAASSAHSHINASTNLKLDYELVTEYFANFYKDYVQLENALNNPISAAQNLNYLLLSDVLIKRIPDLAKNTVGYNLGKYSWVSKVFEIPYTALKKSSVFDLPEDKNRIEAFFQYYYMGDKSGYSKEELKELENYTYLLDLFETVDSGLDDTFDVTVYGLLDDDSDGIISSQHKDFSIGGLLKFVGNAGYKALKHQTNQSENAKNYSIASVYNSISEKYEDLTLGDALDYFDVTKETFTTTYGILKSLLIEPNPYSLALSGLALATKVSDKGIELFEQGQAVDLGWYLLALYSFLDTEDLSYFIDLNTLEIVDHDLDADALQTPSGDLFQTCVMEDYYNKYFLRSYVTLPDQADRGTALKTVTLAQMFRYVDISSYQSALLKQALVQDYSANTADEIYLNKVSFGDLTYSNALTLSSLSLPEGWEWADPTAVPTPDVSLYTIKYEENGYLLTREIAVKVSQANIYPSVSIQNWFYGDNPNDPVVSGNLGNGNVLVEYKIKDSDDSSYTPIIPTEIGDYTARITISETSCYLGNVVATDFSILQPQTISLVISAPSFDAVNEGYAQPDAQAITITSTGNSNATISSAELSGTNASCFTLTEGTSNVTAGGTNTSYTIQPNAGLTAGTYTATITVTYNNNATAMAEVSFTVNALETVVTPTFNPADGEYTEAQSVTISCETDGATIYYTTDGTTPTTSSAVYSSAIAVIATTTIKAIAVKAGMTNSAVASATYTISTPATVATPTFSPTGGTYTSAQNVTISCGTSDATIYYTTDGSAPTTSSSVYSSAIAVSETTTIKAIAVKAGMTTSAAASAMYTINTSPTTYAVTVNNGTGGGSYAAGANVTITADAPASGKQFKEWTGADGLTFTSGSATSSTATFTMPASVVTVTATYEDIPVTTYTVTVNNGTGGGSYAAGASVTITANAPASGKQFKEWTGTDGLTFTSGSKATATATFTMPASAVTVTATYEDMDTVATPTFNPTGGTYTEAQSVTISCGTSGVTIYYTTDGTAPTTASMKYTGAIPVSTTTTIKAIAVKAGMTNSAVASATYTISSVHVHSYTSEVTTEPTCTTTGIRTYTCSACGDTYTEEIPAFGHDYQTIRENEVNATCASSGSYDEVEKCLVCGDVKSRTTKTVPALGHNFENGVCTRCGAVEVTSGNLQDVIDNTTGNTVILALDADTDLSKLKFPKNVKEITIDGCGHTLVFTGAASIKPNQKLTLTNITIKAEKNGNKQNITLTAAAGGLVLENVMFDGKKTTLTASKGDLTLDNVTANDLTVKGAAKTTLTVEGDVSAKTVSGFGKIELSGSMTAAKTLKANTLDLSDNAVLNVVKGAAITFNNGISGNGTINLASGFKAITINGKAIGNIKLTGDKMTDGQLIFKSKLTNLNDVFDVSGIAPEVTDGEYSYGLYSKSGKVYLRAFKMQVGDTTYCEWTDIMNGITKAKASGKDYTLTLLGDLNITTALKLPTKGKYAGLTIDGNGHSISFKGTTLTLTGNLTLKNVNITAMKNGKPVVWTIKKNGFNLDTDETKLENCKVK